MGRLEKYLESMRGASFDMFCKQYKNIAIQLFTWNNLPQGLESERLESMLYDSGKVACFKHKIKVVDEEVDSPLLFLPIVSAYNFNVYNVPQNLRVGKSAQDKSVYADLKIDDCVIVKNNFESTPTRPVVEYYCEKLANIDSAKDLNINATKTPFVMTCDNEKEKLTMLNFFNDIGCSKPLILADSRSKIADLQEKKVLSTGVLPILDKYQQAYLDFKNELLTYLGIDNVSIEKRERLLSGEVDQNNELILDNLLRMYLERKKACEKINKMFGTNISVEITKIEYADNDDTKLNENEMEVEKDEQIHDNSSRDDRSGNSDI